MQPINPHGYGVTVASETGQIYLNEVPLTQRDARDLALSLVEAIQLSHDGNQMREPSYYGAQRILARQQSTIGQALDALRRIF